MSGKEFWLCHGWFGVTESDLWRGKPEDARMAAWDPRDETEE